MNDKQKREVERIKDDWVKVGCEYKEIIDKDNVIYMVLNNGTALSIDDNGNLEWVVKGWR